jgi:hypothetical protein
MTFAKKAERTYLEDYMMGIRLAYGVVGILLVGVFLITLAARRKDSV